MQGTPQWIETEVAQLDHEMKWGGALSSFSDGSLLLRTRDGPGRWDGIFHVDPRTGHVEELECPAAGAFCSLPVTGDRLLVATPGASHALLWNPLTHQIDRVAGEIPHGNWVCSDVYKGAVTIVANQDLSGSSAGFDYEHHQTSLAVFDPEQGRFVQPFQGVEGRNLGGIVVQSETHLLGYAFGRHSSFCRLFSMDLQEPDSDDRPFLRLPFDEWPRFMGTDSGRALVVWGRKGHNHGIVRLTSTAKAFETVWTTQRPRKNRLFFRTALALRDGSKLVFCSEASHGHLLIRYAYPGPVSIVGSILEAPVSCATQAASGQIYVAGAGVIHRLTPPT
ncbi:MAG: hypothetical protein P8R54_23775 [Myxococcota bacterium]|nr:hypothetical protein [Myxococcota bacterium]